MSHIHKEKLTGYLKLTINMQERLMIEEHLDTCEQCFDLYLDMMDDFTPEVKLSDSFTDNTLEKILQSQVFSEKTNHSTSKKDARKTILHYALAAGLTIILMLSGVFQDIVNFTNQDTYTRGPSITESLMSKTESLLNKLDQINKEENGE